MRGVIMNAPGDVRVEERPDPVLEEATDAIIRVTATCVCGSDLWPYRGSDDVEKHPMGHEYIGVVEQIGDDVKKVAIGDFVVGSFVASDNTCEICEAGFQSRCSHQVMMGGIGTQAEKARIPLADGTLVKVPGQPTEEQMKSLLAASDVLGTGWFAADAAAVGPGKTVAVVGDGAVGLMGILAAQRMGAERIIAMSRHADRQALAKQFGATDIVEERGEEGIARIKELTRTVFSTIDCSPRWRERLQQLELATHVIHGQRDPFFPVGNSEALAWEIPKANWTVFEDASTTIPKKYIRKMTDAMLWL